MLSHSRCQSHELESPLQTIHPSYLSGLEAIHVNPRPRMCRRACLWLSSRPSPSQHPLLAKIKMHGQLCKANFTSVLSWTRVHGDECFKISIKLIENRSEPIRGTSAEKAANQAGFHIHGKLKPAVYRTITSQ